MLKNSQSYNEETKTLISQLFLPNANVVCFSVIALLVKQTLRQWLLLLYTSDGFSKRPGYFKHVIIIKSLMLNIVSNQFESDVFI